MARSPAARLALSVAVLVLALPGAARAGWSRPQVLAPPVAADIAGPGIALAANGTAAITYGVQDSDQPAGEIAEVVLRARSGAHSSPVALPGAQAPLAAAYDGRVLELLTGTSPAGFACCSEADAVGLRGGRFAGAQRLVSDLAGPTAAQMVALPGGRVLAATATATGVWTAQANSGGRFGALRRLAGGRATVQALSVGADGGGHTAVAWAAAAPGQALAGSIEVASGGRRGPARRGRTVVSVADGHAIDEMALGGAGTLAWIESWYDRRGGYHAVVRTLDLAPHARVVTLSVPGLASGLALAAAGGGRASLVWRSCGHVCSVEAALRLPRGGFSAPRRLGTIDGTEYPATAVGPRGDALAGWIDEGHVFATAARPTQSSFGVPTRVSATNYAAQLALAFGSGDTAGAVWAQGTVDSEVVGAFFRP